ncbi:kinesin-like protein KIF9 isoform X1 [Dendrobates tinctorius]|uniref:kinesin-like protein KIF9 isoform X1 n=2 Tax=Dendrobates tinctorius TaxID=92724 RepID=UPI003CC9EBB0
MGRGLWKLNSSLLEEAEVRQSFEDFLQSQGSEMSAGSSDVQVFVRFRPTPHFAQDVIILDADNKAVDIHLRKDDKFGVVNNKRYDWSFKVDGVLHDASQATVYDGVAKSVVTRGLQGYNGTIMCYGQTGAGKTYTVTGATENYKNRGVIPRALQQVFKEIDEQSDRTVTVRISYLEIYNETLFDLLSTMPDVSASGTQMTIVDEPQGVSVKGLSLHHAADEEHALNLLFEGETNRIIGSHTLNKSSSRSHCIFTVHLESHSRTLSDAKYTVSKINLVDLAGSERLGKTRSEGQVLREATYINKSLSFLEQTIVALADRRDHVPFRQSKLTHALKDSIGGNCITVLVANIYGEAAQIDETLSTLRFASRMRCVPVETAVVERCDPVRVCKNLQREIEHLRRELAIHDTLSRRPPSSYEPFTDAQMAEIRAQVRRYLDGTLDEIDIVNLRQILEVFSQFKMILNQQEQAVESRLREKYTMIEKSDSAAIAAAQKAGVLDAADGHLVGEMDGSSFGIGAAPFSSKTNRSLSAKKSKGRKSKDPSSPTSRREGAASPAPAKELEATSPSKTMMSLSAQEPPNKEQQETTAMATQRSETAAKEEASRPGTPPPKAAAFEDFKVERGGELNRIFKENKSTLAKQRGKLKEVTQRINLIKKEIDTTSQNLNIAKLEREKQGAYISDEGQVIIDEQEFGWICRLKDLKKQYRADYDELQDLKAEVQYCQKLVDQCRQRLLTEFEIWYNESFVIPEDVQNSVKVSDPLRPSLIPVNKLLSLDEDEQERCDKLQREILMEPPGALPFNIARITTDRKHNYTRAQAQLTPAKKKAGIITSSVKSKPPSMLMAM